MWAWQMSDEQMKKRGAEAGGAVAAADNTGDAGCAMNDGAAGGAARDDTGAGNGNAAGASVPRKKKVLEDPTRPFTRQWRTWGFWRDVVFAFCIFSVVGHWIEVPYCVFMDTCFDIVDDDSLVFADPMYPFLVYGIGAALCSVALVPLKNWLVERFTTQKRALLAFYLLSVVICLDMELGMGFLLNRPDAAGVYPLWDNSYLPGNIFRQAWIVNDVLLGTLATAYTWLFWPLLRHAASKMPQRLAWIVMWAVLVVFVALCIVKFSGI